MKKSGRSWLLLLVLVLVGYGTWRAVAAIGDDDVDGTASAINQIWIERLPQNERDLIKHVVLVKHSRGRFGTLGRSSQWKHEVEIFKWGLEGTRLMLFFPQTRTKAKRTIRVWRCEKEAPKPFQLCLEITGGRSKELYYSREDWIVDPGSVRESLDELAEDTPELAGFFELDVDTDEFEGDDPSF